MELLNPPLTDPCLKVFKKSKCPFLSAEETGNLRHNQSAGSISPDVAAARDLDRELGKYCWLHQVSKRKTCKDGLEEGVKADWQTDSFSHYILSLHSLVSVMSTLGLCASLGNGRRS